MSDSFSLKDLLNPRRRFAGFAGEGLVQISSRIFWNVKIDRYSVENLRKWQQLYDMEVIQWSDHWNFWSEGMEFYVGGRASGKSDVARMMEMLKLAGHRHIISQVGPNLRQLGERVNKRAKKRQLAKQMRPQRSEWRRQERLQNKRLPGR